MASTQIDAGTTITRPGRYTLAREVEGGGGTRLSEAYVRIEADDVVLDGRGLLLEGGGVSDTAGIVVAGVQNVTVENVTLRRWDCGLRFEDVVGGQVRGVTAVGNGYGLSFEHSSLVVVRDCEISGNLVGVVADAESEVVQVSNDVRSNVGRDVFHESN